jgi:hypothetical protein
MSRLPVLVFSIVIALSCAGRAQGQTAGILRPLPSPVFGARPEGPLRLAALAASADSSSRPSPATEWKKGALIGGSVGALYLGTFANRLCHASDDASRRGSCLLSTLGSAAVGAVMGGTLGALIGGQIPDREGHGSSRAERGIGPPYE